MLRCRDQSVYWRIRPGLDVRFPIRDPSDMHTISASYVVGSDGTPRLYWQIVSPLFLPVDQGFRISVSLNGTFNKREAVRQVERSLKRDGVEWLIYKGHGWIFDAPKFRAWLPTTQIKEAQRQQFLPAIEWLTGAAVVEPELAHETVPFLEAQPRISTYVQFDIYRDEFSMDRRTKIFLSHTGANKPMVRRFDSTLTLLGFDPWFDENELTGNKGLHRGIFEGMKNCCAAVFFITPPFKDQKFLEGEIDLALTEKTERGDRFTILSLAMLDETNKRGEVPEILHRWPYKSPETELEALGFIIKSLPLELGSPSWKAVV